VKYTLLLNLILTMSCASWQGASKEKAQMHGQVGASLLESGHYPEALSALLQAAELNSKDPQIQNNLGLAFFYRGRPDKAKTHLERAVDLDSKFTDARNNLGRILIEIKEFKKAEVELKLAVEDLTYPHPQRPYMNLGLLYFKTKNFKEAKVALEKSIYYERSNCYAQTLMGRTLFELKLHDQAAATLDRAIGYCPYQQADEAQYWAGLSYLNAGDLSRSRARFDEIMRLYPESNYRELTQKILNQERF
jgi:type IV pilus assembly protein PilF